MEKIFAWLFVGLINFGLWWMFSKNTKGKYWIKIGFIIAGPIGILINFILVVIFIFNKVMDSQDKRADSNINANDIKDKKEKRHAILFPVIAIITIALVMFYIYLVTNDNPIKVIFQLFS